MKAMKRIKLTLVLIMAMISITQAIAQEKIENNSGIVTIIRPDTIVRTDTIVIKEVITRTDVVHRTETVVRYEENKTGSSEYIKTYKTDIKPDENTVVRESLVSVENNSQIGKRTPPGHPVVSELFPEPHGDGNYVWVPRNMEGKVNDILNGRELSSWKDKKASTDENFDPNEKVTFRGDTLPMVLKSRNLGRFDRGLFNFLYIPKGIWQIGLTASYGEFSAEDLEVLDLISDIDFGGHIFSVRPYFSYFIKNNISVGMRLGYTSGKANIGSFNVDIDEDMSFNLHDIMYKSETYTAALTFSQYLGIARRGRFGFFNEVELAFSSGSSDFHRPFSGEMKETHTTTMQAALNFSPGLCVYILDQLSFNLSFGVFGLNVKHEKQTENGIPLGERTTSGANFRFNIFNINFGIAVNI